MRSGYKPAPLFFKAYLRELQTGATGLQILPYSDSTRPEMPEIRDYQELSDAPTQPERDKATDARRTEGGTSRLVRSEKLSRIEITDQSGDYGRVIIERLEHSVRLIIDTYNGEQTVSIGLHEARVLWGWLQAELPD